MVMSQVLEVVNASTESVDTAARLRSLSTDQLLDRFKEGTAPDTLRVLDGDQRGLGLTLTVFTKTRFHSWLGRYAATPGFLWNGKSFRSKSDTEGWGWNRFAKGPILTIFPFKTLLGASIIDGNTSVIIDYNVKRNPWWERRSWDELREVDPGVFLGFTAIRMFGRYPKVVWFAVDTTRGNVWHAV